MQTPNSSSRSVPVWGRIEKFHAPMRATVRFREAVPEYIALLTAQTHVSLDRFESTCFSRWIERWCQTPLQHVLAEDILQYFAELEQLGASKQNLDREKRLFRSFYKMAHRRGACTHDPTEKLLPQAPTAPAACVFLTADEEKRLLDVVRGIFPPGTPSADSLRRPPVAPPYMRALVLLGLRTGLRLSHILTLEWSQVDFQLGQITIPAQQTWNSRDIEVRLDDETKGALLEILRAAQKAPVLPRSVFEAASLPVWKDRPDEFSVLHALSRVMKYALLPGTDFDVLRLTFVHRCATNNIPILHPVRTGDWEDATLVREVYSRVESAKDAQTEV